MEPEVHMLGLRIRHTGPHVLLLIVAQAKLHLRCLCTTNLCQSTLNQKRLMWSGSRVDVRNGWVGGGGSSPLFTSMFRLLLSGGFYMLCGILYVDVNYYLMYVQVLGLF